MNDNINLKERCKNKMLQSKISKIVKFKGSMTYGPYTKEQTDIQLQHLELLVMQCFKEKI